MTNKERGMKTQEKTNKKYRKVKNFVIVFLTLALIALASFYLFLTFGNKHENAKSKPIIALVNEDKTGNFNDADYNFGTSFVNIVSNDDKYNWQVVSRSVADRAYADKSIDAVIYLPQTFSQDILTLQVNFSTSISWYEKMGLLKEIK